MNQSHERRRRHVNDEFTDAIRRLDITGRVVFSRDRSSLIGEGSYGQVYYGLCKDDSGISIPVVIKIMRNGHVNNQKAHKYLLRELASWKSVSHHDNVADFLGIYRTPHDPPYLVMHWYKNLNLLRYMANYRYEDRLVMAKGIAKDIARGLDRLHSSDVVHGDIKPENVLVSNNGRPLIADFGLSVIPDMQGFTTTAGPSRNPLYSAPELLPLTEGPPVYPTKASDIFSLGMLFLQLFDGHLDRLPYQHVRMNDDPSGAGLILRIHRKERPQRESYPNMSDRCWNIMVQCWRTRPSDRPDIRKVRGWLDGV